MKKQDISQQYRVPIEILENYESWGLCDAVKVVMGDWHYDDQDLERLGKIMALHQIGFENDEIKLYMQLLIEDPNSGMKRLKILDEQRCRKLDEIHYQERQLEQIDYLRHEIRKATPGL